MLNGFIIHHAFQHETDASASVNSQLEDALTRNKQHAHTMHKVGACVAVCCISKTLIHFRFEENLPWKT